MAAVPRDGVGAGVRGAGATARASSFSRATATTSAKPMIPGVKHGLNGASFVSSGIPNLDRFWEKVYAWDSGDGDGGRGGAAPSPSFEEFMAQGLVHCHSLLFAAPSKEPRVFLGTLSSPISGSKDERPRMAPGLDLDAQDHDKGLRIAWQYKKYFGEQQSSELHTKGVEALLVYGFG